MMNRSLIHTVLLLFFLIIYNKGELLAPLYAFPKVSCDTAWKDLTPGGKHLYDFKSREKYSAYRERVKRKNCYKDWTVMVFMAADNDLAPYAMQDLLEMEAAFSPKSPYKAASTVTTDLVVQIDSTGDKENLRRYHMFQSPRKYVLRTKQEELDNATFNEVLSPVVDLIAKDSATKASKRLFNFLGWAAENYPSKHTMLIIWGHGKGWGVHEGAGQSSGAGPKPQGGRFFNPGNFPVDLSGLKRLNKLSGKRGGIAFSSNPAHYIDIPELRNVLKDNSDIHLRGKRIDVYASDACLMQSLEVVYELRDVARYVIGSPQIQNFLGFPYRRLMRALNGKTFGLSRKTMKQLRASGTRLDEPRLLVKGFSKLFISFYRYLGGSKDPTVMLSSVSTDALNNVMPKLAEFSKLMAAYLEEDMFRGMDVRFLIQNSLTFGDGYRDVSSFLFLVDELVKKEISETGGTRLSHKLKKVLGDLLGGYGIDYALMSYEFGDAYHPFRKTMNFMKARGLSVWVPGNSSEYGSRKKYYESSSFHNFRNGAWRLWLETIN